MDESRNDEPDRREARQDANTEAGMEAAATAAELAGPGVVAGIGRIFSAIGHALS
ncbi:hypothetical protein [Nocardia huaxiensis]|uniref:Uncharacterized protein n=1 Tax=Nocardia huaxiensis TaxID=2755382 RepID=A0A7D6ZFN2_9NOCA|nr:hypothetical protein [Nocardia huaxiensis]QLY29779.1 hypothetical protein H0264_31905 [Nocardia huaxiensis]UFS96636.1 hypothetical protein LPY97_01470 [Nocardia huaxiensis]